MDLQQLMTNSKQLKYQNSKATLARPIQINEPQIFIHTAMWHAHSSSQRGSSRASASPHECKQRKHHVQASLHRQRGSCTPCASDSNEITIHTEYLFTILSKDVETPKRSWVQVDRAFVLLVTVFVNMKNLNQSTNTVSHLNATLKHKAHTTVGVWSDFFSAA